MPSVYDGKIKLTMIDPLNRLTAPDGPVSDPDQPGSSGCMWVEITHDNGETEWIHFFGLSHNAFVEMSKIEKTPPWLIKAANDTDPPVF